MSWADFEGSPFPLGQSWVAATQSYNFALYSKHATRVTLLLYKDSDPANPVLSLELDHLRHKSGRVWHVRVPKAHSRAARYYAWQVDGPPSGEGFERHAFDATKIASDPCAQAVFFPPGFARMASIGAGSNAGRAPLGVLTERPAQPRGARARHMHHEADLVIYEMHVRGFTRHPSSGVAPSKRGTYAGVTEKIPYLRELGVTAVELMPVFQFDPQEDNYWGYNPLFLFAPHAGYASDPDPVAVLAEFRALVEALHAADIEVILDVVYNHTGEGNEHGPAYNLKLIDNSTYYMVSPENGAYMNFSGTGNSLHCANRAVRRLVLESLRYWTQEMGVDGFRFDLASVFARASDGSINSDDPPLFSQIAADPALAHVRLIAEPWDAAGGYQLGRGFAGMTWQQWNGRYRDTIQRFVRGDPGMVGEMMSRVYGSADLFPDDVMNAYRPVQSVNYVSSHDGFSLYDLTAYDHKHNEANGQHNTDGPDDHSWNCGWEGDTNLPLEVLQLRLRQLRNFFTLLLVSNGTPMFRMGDEFAQTQGGNNNPYNQDNETSWLDWGRLERHPDLFRFVRELIGFRKRHPSLGRSRFWREDVRWHGVGPDPDLSPASHTFAFCLKASAEDAEQAGSAGNPPELYVIANAYWEDLDFGIHEPGPWKLAVDTGREPPGDIYGSGSEPAVGGPAYRVRARSVVVLVSG